MTTELQKRDEQLPTIPSEEEVGVSGALTRDDVVTPTCSIVQPSSGTERGEQGHYWFSDGYATKRLESVVVLEIAGTRTLWAPKGEGDASPVCRSADREMGLTNKPSQVLGAEAAKNQMMQDGEPAYIPCSHCPHANDDPFGSGEWLCKPGYTLMLYEAERGPFLFFVKGTAVPPVKRMIVSPALMRINNKKPAAPWTTFFDFSLRMTENDKGKFYVPDIQAGGDTPNPEDYAQMSVDLRGRVSAEVVQAVEEEVQQPVNGEPAT